MYIYNILDLIITFIYKILSRFLFNSNKWIDVCCYFIFKNLLLLDMYLNNYISLGINFLFFSKFKLLFREKNGKSTKFGKFERFHNVAKRLTAKVDSYKNCRD